MISDADLLAHTRAESTETTYLRQLEKAAIANIQNRTGRYFGVEAQDFIENLERRGNLILLSNDPADGEIELESWDGSAWTVVDTSSYTVIGRTIYFSDSVTLPAQYRATYDTGYEEDTDENVWPAPDDIKQAVLLLVGDWYENREAVVVGESQAEMPLAVTALIDPHIKVTV